MHGIDWHGLATFIGAVGGFLGVLVSLSFQIINFYDQRRARLEQDTHKAMLQQLTQKVETISGGNNA